MKDRLILDLCAGTGAWSEPYREAGYEVIMVDLPQDVRLMRKLDRPVHGILAAPPCTVFSQARNRYPPTNEEFKEGLSIIDACLRIIAAHQSKWWALENPAFNKINWWLGPPVWVFRQWEYGDAADKPTGLWGDFTAPLKCPGKRTKPSTYKTSRQNADPKDAITPPCFARAFFEANP